MLHMVQYYTWSELIRILFLVILLHEKYHLYFFTSWFLIERYNTRMTNNLAMNRFFFKVAFILNRCSSLFWLVSTSLWIWTFPFISLYDSFFIVLTYFQMLLLQVPQTLFSDILDRYHQAPMKCSMLHNVMNFCNSFVPSVYGQAIQQCISFPCYMLRYVLV